MRVAEWLRPAVRHAVRPGMLLFTCLVISGMIVSAAAAQSPTPAPAPPGSGGTTFGSVRVLAGNGQPRNPGQENQPPIWLTIDAKGAAAVVTIGNATRVPLNFSGTVVMSLAPGARGTEVLVSTGTATIEGNQIVWTGFSLDSTQIVPAIVMLAPSGSASAAIGSAISEVSIDAKDQTGAVVTERAAGGGPTLAALASAPVRVSTALPVQTGPAAIGVTPLSRSDARAYGALALGLMTAALAGIVLTGLLVYSTGHRIEREVRTAAGAWAQLDTRDRGHGAERDAVLSGPPTQAHGNRPSPTLSEPALSAELEAVAGAEAGRRWTVEQIETNIGRNDGNDVVVADRTVSERHARLTRQPDGSYVLSDNGSTNGTQVNGRPATGPIPLRDGDEVRFGNMAFVFHKTV